MLPSCSRVKLNRSALKDVTERRPEPRRRGLSQSEMNTVAAPSNQEEKLSSELEPDTDTPSGPFDYKPRQRFVTHQRGELKGSSPAVRTAKEPKHLLPCAVLGADIKPDGPNTRGKYQRAHPNTRSRSRRDHLRSPCSLRYSFIWCVCKVSDRPPVKRPGSRHTVKQGYTLSRATRLRAGRNLDVKCASRGGGGGRVSRVRFAGRGERSAVEAKSAAGDLQPAANAGRVPPGAPLVPTPPAITDVNAVLPSGPALSSLRKTLGKQQHIKCRRPRTGSPAALCGTQKGTAVTDDSRIIIWIKRRPKVTLCDVANGPGFCCRGCGYLLTGLLKSRSVRCFKQAMRAGFRFTPGCFADKHGANQKAPHDAPPGGQAVTSQNDPENQKRLECFDSQRSSNHAAKRVHKRLSEDSATSHSSLHTTLASKANCWAGGACFGSRSHAEIRKEEQATLGNCNDPSSTTGSALEENCAGKQLWGVTQTHGAQMSSEHECVADTDDPDSFTCQRVNVYLGKSHFSCARAYMSWPFADSKTTRSSPVPTSAHPARPVETCARTESDANRQPDSLCTQVKDKHPHAPRATQRSNRESCARVTSLPARERVKAAEKSVAMPPAWFCSLPRCGRAPGTGALPSSSLPASGQEDDSSVSTPSPVSHGPSDWETTPTLSPMSSPFARGRPSSPSATPSSLPPPAFQLQSIRGGQAGAGRTPLFHSEETQMASSSSQSSPLTHSSDSCSSLLLLPLQDRRMSDEELSTDGSLPNLVPFTAEHNVGLNRFLLPPVLSPITSPIRRSWRGNLSRQCSDHSHDEEGEREPGNDARHGAKTDGENAKDHSITGIDDNQGVLDVKAVTHTCPEESQPSSSSDEDESDKEERQDVTDFENDAEQSRGASQQNPSDPQTEANLPPGVLSKPSSPSSDAEGPSEDSWSPSEAGSPGGGSRAEAAGGSQPGFLDEFMAYEQDILLVGVDEEDPELFDNLPEQKLLKLGPARVVQAAKTKANTGLKTIHGPAAQPEQKWTGMTSFHCSSPDNADESVSRPWRPHCRVAPAEVQFQSDALNNHINGTLERSRPPVQTASTTHSIPLLMSGGAGPCVTNTASTTDYRRQKFNGYCRLYFSETLSCTFKICRFQHLPAEGDEKFCLENVVRFTNNPMCLQKAGALYSGYYQNNPPGVYFSVSVFLALLWALLRAGMVSDILPVLHVSSAHNVVPSHEFLLALFNYVREKSLMGFTPELMRLIYKMAGAGLELSLDCLDCVKNAPLFQQMVHTSSPPLFSSNAVIPKHLKLAYAIVEIELCIKQEDWKLVGEAFRSACQSSEHPNQVERISGRVTIALLSECKDKLSLPFAAFADAACQTEGQESLLRSFVGRIGVSLMLRYHKTHHWIKGRRVVEKLSSAKVNYSSLKGLFGNEDRASRCFLITVASELFLLSGSVEGALNTLRENKWFVSSCSWPCEPADLESRTRVLVRLAEKTSHRDTLEVLRNLPGLKEPNDSIDISNFSPLFKSHLQLCVERQILPVAADTADFMLSKRLAIDLAVLQMLLQKMGRQNLWLRAREVFRHSLNMGYFPEVSAPPGFMTLMVPCRLGEVELALAFEMFVTANATAIFRATEASGSVLSVTLKRTQSSESEYLSAGSRLLSAACILQPKLLVHCTAVKSVQEQMFTVDVASAQRWLRHNHMWASEVWTC